MFVCEATINVVTVVVGYYLSVGVGVDVGRLVVTTHR